MLIPSSINCIPFTGDGLTDLVHGCDNDDCTVLTCRQAERQGWDYLVQVPREPKIPAKNYGKYILMLIQLPLT